VPDVSYVPGPLVAVAGDQCWALVEASPDSPVVTRIWQRLGQAPAAEAVLAGLLADGFRGVPSMALLTTGADGQHRLFCRGAVCATVQAQGAAERVSGSGLLTWREQVVVGAARIVLGEPPADSAVRLPATSGVLLAGCVAIDFTNFAERETTGSYDPAQPTKTAPADPAQPKKTIVYFPDTITVPPAGVGRGPEQAGRASQESGGPATAPAHLAAGQHAGDGEYDFLWGATQLRTVEDAAVRGPGDGDLVSPGPLPRDGVPVAGGPWDGALPSGPPSAGYPDPAPPTRLWREPAEPWPPGAAPSGSQPPGPPGGLIDVPQWLASPGGSAATVKRADVPSPVASTVPPDRIGPVVPALVCPGGHLNPPSGATCRRCGASLPPDPVPVPRPVLGVLRLSLGDVITLDRGVLMGRNPRPDFAADGAERPHVVKLPAADGDVSRTHLRVTLDGWHVLVTDLNSTNGTLVALPGHEPQQLRAGEPTLIQSGAVVTLADGIYFRYEVPD